MFKIKNEPNLSGLRVGFVTPMDSLKKTLRKLTHFLPGLKPGDILSPSDVTKNDRYDILLVDEARRLGNYLSMGSGIKAFYNTCDRLGLPHTSNQVDWIFKCCDKAYLFYDPKQQVRASGLNRDGLEQRLNQLEEASVETEEFSLRTQMRVRGGDKYLDFVYNLLDNKVYMHAGMKLDVLFSSEPYDSRAGDPNSDVPGYQLGIISRFEDFCSMQQAKEEEVGLSRMTAGFVWKWETKKHTDTFDTVIEGVPKRWNSSQKDWVNFPNAINEVGCIHTVQGYDLNYGFVILGPDIYYNTDKGAVCANKANFKDAVAKKKASDDDLQTIIVNAYYVLMTRGMLGTFLYVCDPALKEYLSRYIPVV